MDRRQLTELHYITPFANVPSIMANGLLSHSRAQGHHPESIAMAEVQDRRAQVTVPGGQRLHQYVNLYICGRNPMMYSRLAHRDQLCVLSVAPAVLDLPGVVVTDGNASSEYVRFSAAPGGLAIVNHALTFADDWRDGDQIQYFRKKSAKCAEVLVPNRVDPRYLQVAYVWNAEAKQRLEAQVTIQVALNPHLFFG